jgi:hypothetical protein
MQDYCVYFYEVIFKLLDLKLIRALLNESFET